MFSYHNGFTLVELMIVVTLVIFASLIALNVNFSGRIDSENRDHFVSKIMTTINQTRTDTLLGRWVGSSGATINPDTTQILMNTGAITVRYLSGGVVIGTGTQLQSPFYGDAFYSIPDIQLERSDGTLTPTDANFAIGFQGANVFFTGGTNDTSAIILQIHTRYKEDTQTICLDRRTGKLDATTNTGCTVTNFWESV